MLLWWVVLFSLLTIHGNNYRVTPSLKSRTKANKQTHLDSPDLPGNQPLLEPDPGISNPAMVEEPKREGRVEPVTVTTVLATVPTQLGMVYSGRSR